LSICGFGALIKNGEAVITDRVLCAFKLQIKSAAVTKIAQWDHCENGRAGVGNQMPSFRLRNGEIDEIRNAEKRGYGGGPGIQSCWLDASSAGQLYDQ
jgi:hypothetical protein